MLAARLHFPTGAHSGCTTRPTRGLTSIASYRLLRSGFAWMTLSTLSVPSMSPARDSAVGGSAASSALSDLTSPAPARSAASLPVGLSPGPPAEVPAWVPPPPGALPDLPPAAVPALPAPAAALPGPLPAAALPLPVSASVDPPASAEPEVAAPPWGPVKPCEVVFGDAAAQGARVGERVRQRR